MTRPLLIVFLVMEALDLALYAQAPTFESGPMGAVPPPVVVVAKVTAVVLVVGLASLLAYLWPKWWGASLVLAVGIAIAAFGAGTAAATLSIVNAAEAPRAAQEQRDDARAPALLPAPPTHPRSADRGTGDRQPFRVDAFRPAKGSHPGAMTATPAARVPTGGGGANRPLATADLALRGIASWVDAKYGPHYLAARMPKGTQLRVCGPVGCITGTVNDYGPRKRVFPGRIVDLSRYWFGRVCGDPDQGTCPVRVQVVLLRLPATDR